MHFAPLALFVVTTLCAAFGTSSAGSPVGQDPQDKGGEMAAMMAKAKKFTSPGPHHKQLEPMIGSWTTETRGFVGGKALPPEKGEAEFHWAMKDRWVEGTWKGTLMRMPIEGLLVMGYDNFKQTYVYTQVTNMDTAMIRTEGRTDPATKSIVTYGTLDEYLTGEHDKALKIIWRFPSADSLMLEVHDLAIGENNTKVFEVAYTRKK